MVRTLGMIAAAGLVSGWQGTGGWWGEQPGSGPGVMGEVPERIDDPVPVKPIAESHPGDVGIADDRDVLFAEGFEGETLPKVGWEKVGGFYDFRGWPEVMRTTEKEAAMGKRSLELVHPKDVVSPAWMHRKFEEQQTVYVRFYRKYEKEWAWAPMGMHDTYLFAGEFHSPTSTDLTLYLDNSTLNRVQNCKFSGDAAAETRQPLAILRSALQGPEGKTCGLDFGTGKEIVVGEDFKYYYGLPYNKSVAPVFEGGRWYCIEAMAKMNTTPTSHDGEVRMWVDGALVTEMTGLTLRNEAHKEILWDHWMLGPRYGGPAYKGGPVKEQRSWIDGLVVAKRRVGPVKPVSEAVPTK